MTDEDKQRLFRNVKLSVYDLEKLLNATRDMKSFYFRNGIKEEVEYLQSLEEKLKEAIVKESV